MTIRIIFAVLITLCFLSTAIGGEIHNAVKAGDLDKVKELLSVDPILLNALGDLEGEEGVTPFVMAAFHGKKDIVEFLLTKGANVNSEIGKAKVTALHACAYKNKLETAKILLLAGAKIDFVNVDNHTPLFIAAEEGNYEVAELLIEADANLDIQSTFDMWTGYTALTIAIKNKHLKIAIKLIKAGADVRIKDQFGWSLINRAAAIGSTEVTKLLLEKGLDVNARTDSGHTPLYLSIYNKHSELTKYLRGKGGVEK